MIAGALLVIVGVQVVALGLCAHAYGTYFMGEKDPWFDRMRARFRLEHGLLLGGAMLLAGLVVAAAIVVIWVDRGFGAARRGAARGAAAALIIVGLQVFFTSFLLSILGLPATRGAGHRRDPRPQRGRAARRGARRRARPDRRRRSWSWPTPSSTDGSAELARSFGARSFPRRFCTARRATC